MGCVESSNKPESRRSRRGGDSQHGSGSYRAAAGRRRKTAGKTAGKRSSRKAPFEVLCVDIGVQTDLEGVGTQLLRRLSSGLKRASLRHRGQLQHQAPVGRSASAAAPAAEPPDTDLLFDLDRVVATKHSQVARYIDQALVLAERAGAKSSGGGGGEGEGEPAAATTAEEKEELSTGGAPISSREVALVQRSWREVEKDPAEFGTDLFVRLLLENPTFRDLFPFGKADLTVEGLSQDPELQAHGVRVMETVGTAVGGLDGDWEVVVPILQDLGGRHKVYGATIDHFEPLLDAFLYSLRNGLAPKLFTRETEDAWRNFWTAVAERMGETMRADEAVDQNANEVHISPADRQLVQGCWKAIIQADRDKFGVEVFVRLLEQNPSIGSLFPFGKLNLPRDKLRVNADLGKHAGGFMEALGRAVNGLDDLANILPLLSDLGAKHKLYGARPEHFEPLVEAWMKTLEATLPADILTPDAEMAWRTVLEILAGLVGSSMSGRSERSDLKLISVREKSLVQDCWKHVQKDLVNIGATLFVRLLERNPPARELFAFGKLVLPPGKLRQNKELRAHGQRVMGTIGAVVAGLDDLDIVCTILEDLGTRHRAFGARPEHFPPLEEAFMYAMKASLPSKVLTAEVQRAWQATMEAVATIMGSTMGGASEADRAVVSQTDKDLVRNCWRVIEKDWENLGADLFVRLLDQNPSIGKLFTFGQLNLPSDKLRNHPDLRKHAKGVMETIGMAVSGLDDVGKTGPFLEDLGARHKLYGAKPEHFPALQEAFLYAMKNGLSPKVFTPEVQEAWRSVLGLVDVTMSRTMRSEEPAVSSDEPVSSRHKSLVRACWRVIQKDSDNLGAALFVRLIEKNPSIGKLFTFGQLNLPSDKLSNHPDLRKHAKGVMETIGMAVSGLDDVGKTGPFLEDLGARHKLYGAKPEHFPALQEAFLYSMKNGLSPKVFTPEVQEAWGSVLGLVDETMSRTMSSDEANGTDGKGLISSKDKLLVRACWKVIQKDSDNLGAALFVSLIEKNPVVGKLFTFGQLNLPSDKLSNHPDLRKHAKGVMETIGMAVSGLDDVGKTGPFLEDLGARHQLYGAKAEHFPAFAEAFMVAMKNGLSPKVFSPEVQEAWRSILGMMEASMVQSMRSDGSSSGEGEVISTRHKELIRTSWGTMERDLDHLGASVFTRLLDQNRGIGELFQFGQLSLPPQMLKHNSDLRAHGRLFMDTLATLVERLDNLSDALPYLQDLGTRHRFTGAKPEHFRPLAQAFMQAMRAGLSATVFTSDVQTAWTELWKLIATVMADTMQ